MALATATVTYDFADITGVDYAARHTRVYVTTNIPDQTVVDTSSGNKKVRVGGALGVANDDTKKTLADDGTGTVSVWVPSAAANPNSWQTYIHFDYDDRTRRGQKTTRTFGPFTITGNANLADLIEEQEVPPTYLTHVTAQLQTYVNEVERLMGLDTVEAAARDAVVDLVIDPADVGGDGILVVGQSNAQGYGRNSDALLDPGDSRIFQVPSSGPYKGREIPATEPLIHYSQLPASIGHALSFARKLVRATPVNRRLVILPCAMGSTGFQDNTSGGGGTWDQTIDLPVSGLNLARQAVANTNAWLAQNPNNRLRVIIWHQGEADASFGRSTADYAAKWDALKAYFWANITGATKVPVIVGEMLPEDAARTGKAAIQAAHVATPGRTLLTAFTIGPRGYPQYNNGVMEQHYTAEGQRVLGERTFVSYLRALTNVLNTPPVPPSVLTLVQAGTSVTATWDQPMGRTTSYIVQKSVNGAAWSDVTHPTLDVTEQLTSLAAGTAVQFRVCSVNEQGTSAWITSATLTTVSAPGQVTGLTTGSASSSAQQLSWTPTSGATSYLVEYKKSADSTWTTFGTVSAAAATVTGLTASTSYDYRVTASNAAGSGAVSATATATTADLQPILTDVPVASFRAVGLRKLKAGATQCIRVRRSSDNAETDIGFVGMLLDTAAVQTFGGSGDVFVKTFYDQSGNGRNRTQTDTTKQAQVLFGGALLLKQGRPYATLRGIYTDASVGLHAAGAATLAAVLESPGTTTPALATFVSESTSTAGGTVYTLLNITAAWRNQMLLRNEGAVTTLNSGGAGAVLTGGPHSVVNTDYGAAVVASVDGSAATQVAYTRSGTVSPTASNLGGYNAAVEPADFAEAIEWASALSDDQRGAAHLNQRSYYSTP